MENTKKTILLVEDSPEVLDVIRCFFNRTIKNYVLETAVSVPEANEKISQLGLDQIEKVFTDGDLLKGKGWEVAKGLRERGFTRPIFYSGSSELPSNYEQYYNNSVEKIRLAEILGQDEKTENCYRCFNGCKFDNSCKIYTEYASLGITKPGEKCSIMTSFDTDLKKVSVKDPSVTYVALLLRVLRERGEKDLSWLIENRK